jgi:hypothetical protein
MSRNLLAHSFRGWEVQPASDEGLLDESFHSRKQKREKEKERKEEEKEKEKEEK